MKRLELKTLKHRKSNAKTKLNSKINSVISFGMHTEN